jgi:hypothetical protein
VSGDGELVVVACPITQGDIGVHCRMVSIRGSEFSEELEASVNGGD